jgi:hypothetical protein
VFSYYGTNLSWKFRQRWKDIGRRRKKIRSREINPGLWFRWCNGEFTRERSVIANPRHPATVHYISLCYVQKNSVSILGINRYTRNSNITNYIAGASACSSWQRRFVWRHFCTRSLAHPTRVILGCSDCSSNLLKFQRHKVHSMSVRFTWR